MSATLGTNGPAFMGTFTTQGNPIYRPAAMTPTQPSATPRTDEEINGKPCTRFALLAGDSLRDALVSSSFARTLETELAAAKAECERLKALSDNAASAVQWATEEFAAQKVRAERAEAEALAQAAILGRSAEREADLLGKLARAEHALAAALKDSQRLDWYDSPARPVPFSYYPGDFRAAIDAAMTNSNHKTT